MACKYHPYDGNTGTCVACGSDYCTECGVSFPEGMKCLDCTVEYAGKKLFQSYIATGLGLLGGISSGVQAGGAMIVFGPILGAYGLFALFWGWHYGRRIWPWLGYLAGRTQGNTSLVLFFLLLWFRLMFSYIVGIFGGGIAGFLWCRNLVKRREQFALGG